jgi:hypothetical protein
LRQFQQGERRDPNVSYSSRRRNGLHAFVFLRRDEYVMAHEDAADRVDADAIITGTF